MYYWYLVAGLKSQSISFWLKQILRDARHEGNKSLVSWDASQVVWTLQIFEDWYGSVFDTFHKLLSRANGLYMGVVSLTTEYDVDVETIHVVEDNVDIIWKPTLKKWLVVPVIGKILGVSYADVIFQILNLLMNAVFYLQMIGEQQPASVSDTTRNSAVEYVLIRDTTQAWIFWAVSIVFQFLHQCIETLGALQHKISQEWARTSMIWSAACSNTVTFTKFLKVEIEMIWNLTFNLSNSRNSTYK